MQQLLRIADSLSALNRRLDNMERIIDPQNSLGPRRRSVSSRSSVRGGGGGGGIGGIGISLGNDPLSAVTEMDENDNSSANNMDEDDLSIVAGNKQNLHLLFNYDPVRIIVNLLLQNPKWNVMI